MPAQPLKVTPITSLRLEIDPQKLALAEQRFLDLGCIVQLTAQAFFVSLPPGTVEEIWPGRWTHHRGETTIRLPDGRTFTKVIRFPYSPQIAYSVAFPEDHSGA